MKTYKSFIFIHMTKLLSGLVRGGSAYKIPLIWIFFFVVSTSKLWNNEVAVS